MTRQEWPSPSRDPTADPKTALNCFQSSITVIDSGGNSISSGSPQGKDFTCRNPEIKTERCVCFFKCTGTFSRLHRSQWIRHTWHQERTNNARKKLSAFVRVSVRKARQSKVNRLGMATLNNFRGFWVIGAVPSFLALRWLSRGIFSAVVWWPERVDMTLDWLI